VFVHSFWTGRCQACEQNATAAYFDTYHVITRLLWVEFPKAFPFQIPARDFITAYRTKTNAADWKKFLR